MSIPQFLTELFIAGIPCSCWMLLAVLSIIKPDLSLLTLNKDYIPLLVIIYLPFALCFGIIIDRLSDWLFQWKDKSIRKMYFKNSDLMHEGRLLLFSKSEEIVKFMDYIRHRMRIIRNFFLNTILLAGFIFLFLKQYDFLTYNVGLLIILTALFLITFSGFSAIKLHHTYYKQLSKGIDLLKGEKF